MTGSLRVALGPGQWRAGPPLVDNDPRPDRQADLDVQLVPWTLQHMVDEVDRPTGWVAAQGYWLQDGAVAPLLIRLLVRAEALPEGVVPEPPGGGDR